MNLKYYQLTLLCVLSLTFGCKKELKQNPEIKTSEKIKVESGHLTFENYDDFLSKFQSISSMSADERSRWEKSMGFVSLNTIYQNFDNELTEIEQTETSRSIAMDRYNKLKEKYAGQFIFSDSTYVLDCSGVRESYLADKDGVVKIGDDIVYFKGDGVKTYNTKTRTYANPLNTLSSLKAGHNTISSIPTSQPAVNSFNVAIGTYNVLSSNNGKFYSRIKLYNIHSAAAGYRGFVSMECYAQHRNILGIWHDVRSFVGVRGNIFVGLSKSDGSNNFTTTSNTIFVGSYGDLGQNNGQGQGNSAVADRYELLLAASQYLKNNPSAVSGTGNTIDFGNLPGTIDDDFLQPNGYWSSTSNMFVGPLIPFTLNASSIADGIGGGTNNYSTGSFYW